MFFDNSYALCSATYQLMSQNEEYKDFIASSENIGI